MKTVYLILIALLFSPCLMSCGEFPSSEELQSKVDNSAFKVGDLVRHKIKTDQVGMVVELYLSEHFANPAKRRPGKDMYWDKRVLYSVKFPVDKTMGIDTAAPGNWYGDSDHYSPSGFYVETCLEEELEPYNE